MPVDVKRKRRLRSNAESRSEQLDDDQDSSPLETVTVFVFKPRWFVLSQTEGDPYIPTELPQWSEERALTALGIERVFFSHMNGNCQGFARGRQVAVSPIALSPHSTLFHEIGHVVLGHTQEGMLIDHDRTPKSLREAEAESVALICCESLNLPGAAECRGYIQHWLSGETIPEKSALKIFKAADTVLKAGRPNSPKPEHRGRRKTVA